MGMESGVRLRPHPLSFWGRGAPGRVREAIFISDTQVVR
jgi:hypothetical protein